MNATSTPVLGARPARPMPTFLYPLVKRALDIVVSAALLVTLAPVMGAVAAAIWWRMGRPVLFKQRRASKDGRPFVIYKFRTMAVVPGETACAGWDPRRITPLGHRLRALSLDELPQLWNVLCGDMSLVGPRPLYEHYIPWFTAREARRLAVRPGVTGWAQVHGRANARWDERLEMDAWYVEHRGFGLDLVILGLTILRVMQRRDVDPTSPGRPLALDVERRLQQEARNA